MQPLWECRIRVWDYMLSADGPPDREIVHSHDFNRYLTPFRAEWDPKDPAERTFVVGRRASSSAMLCRLCLWLWTVLYLQCSKIPPTQACAARMLGLLAVSPTGLWVAQIVALSGVRFQAFTAVKADGSWGHPGTFLRTSGALPCILWTYWTPPQGAC